MLMYCAQRHYLYEVWPQVRGVLGSYLHDYQGNGTFTALPDEQFNMYGSRVEKTGFYGFLDEGRICIDARAIAGLLLTA